VVFGFQDPSYPLEGHHKTNHVYRGEGFVITGVISDNESSLISLESSINSMGAKLSIGGPKSNAVAKLDRHIRFLKEREIHSLWTPLRPSILLKYAVDFAIHAINLPNVRSPREF
jgi:hypothetical protein